MLPMMANDAREERFVLRLPAFEGPLDLLLYLIEKNRFTLENLEVCPIIEQYLHYVEQARSLDVSLAGEFLEMASYLIWLKSCLLLPSTKGEDGEEGFNPAAELKEMLQTYRAIRMASQELSTRPMLFRDRFPKGMPQEERDISSMGIGALLEAISSIKARTKQHVLNVTFTRFNIQFMIDKIQGLLKLKGRVSLFEVADAAERMELIGAFLAMLELSKRSLARIIQSRLFAVIYITGR
ncbi:MAG TPA: ScpA family protein [Deltaproteobacteria bacterium]|jgi:segregation and condensation protein A|nr:ScpA family protein [Deltaproteobacteria bacterium]HOI08545.1 ScpA family protein [Deltaproteobacteria bacterium]